ncbi:hypothetical protein C8Q74DRAFT_1279685 [Fomes fomentarius]|nr:hypothetical protein C8Q74DRAFT_1279685 [Fomes fomentarius]
MRQSPDPKASNVDFMIMVLRYSTLIMSSALYLLIVVPAASCKLTLRGPVYRASARKNVRDRNLLFE